MHVFCGLNLKPPWMARPDPLSSAMVCQEQHAT
jgi:hypothetical protein